MAAPLLDGDVFAELALVPDWLQPFDGVLGGLALVLVDLCPALQVTPGDSSRVSQPSDAHRDYRVRGRCATVSHHHCREAVPKDPA